MSEMLSCPVCLEEYSETGDRVPRLLPCSHTLCHGCVRLLLTRGKETVTCPEDRVSHRAHEGERSFPQTRYVLEIIKQHQQQKPKYEMCSRHGRECSLYCDSPQCKKQICQLCLIQEHRDHDCADLEQKRQEFCQRLLNTVDGLSEELLETKKSLMAARQEVSMKTQRSIRDIQKTQDEFLKQFAAMMREVQEQSKDSNKHFDKELKVIEDTIAMLQEIRESTDVETDSQETVSLRLDQIAKNTRDFFFRFPAARTLSYREYRAPLPEAVRVLGGRLVQGETDVSLQCPGGLATSVNSTIPQIKSTGKDNVSRIHVSARQTACELMN